MNGWVIIKQTGGLLTKPGQNVILGFRSKREAEFIRFNDHHRSIAKVNMKISKPLRRNALSFGKRNNRKKGIASLEPFPNGMNSHRLIDPDFPGG